MKVTHDEKEDRLLRSELEIQAKLMEIERKKREPDRDEMLIEFCRPFSEAARGKVSDFAMMETPSTSMASRPNIAVRLGLKQPSGHV